VKLNVRLWKIKKNLVVGKIILCGKKNKNWVSITGDRRE